MQPASHTAPTLAPQELPAVASHPNPALLAPQPPRTSCGGQLHPLSAGPPGPPRSGQQAPRSHLLFEFFTQNCRTN